MPKQLPKVKVLRHSLGYLAEVSQPLPSSGYGYATCLENFNIVVNGEVIGRITKGSEVPVSIKSLKVVPYDKEI